MIKKIILILLLPLSLFADIKVFECSSEGVQELKVVKEKGSLLPDQLIIPPGIYSFKGKTYNVSKGVVRFCDILKENQQRLVWNGNLYDFIAGITWIHTHGYQHDSNSNKSTMDIARNRKVIKTCGGIVAFTKSLLETLGIRARAVTLLTLDEWNDYFNGHTVLEVYWDNSWQLIDVDLKYLPLFNHLPIEARQFTNLVATDDLIFKKISNAPILSTHCQLGKYDFCLWMESLFSDLDLLKKEYLRCGNVVMIEEKGKWYFSHPEKNRIEKMNKTYRYLEKDKFDKKFYSFTEN